MTAETAAKRSPEPDKSVAAEQLALKLEELEETLREAGFVSPRGQWWLGEQQDEAAELVALLHEAAPKLALSGLQTPPRQSPHLPKARSFELLPDAIRHRLTKAVPIPTGPGQINWQRLVATISSETARPLAQASGTAGGHNVLEINSGGRVLFCLFEREPSPTPTPPSSLAPSPEKGAAPVPAPWSLAESPTRGLVQLELDGGQMAAAQTKALTAKVADVLDVSSSQALELLGHPAAMAETVAGKIAEGMAAAAAAAAAEPEHDPAGPPPQKPPLLQLPWAAPAEVEGCLVLKFVPTRLLCQSEQFASELTRHVGLCAPDSRILRQQAKGEGSSEWAEAHAAAAAIKECGFPDLYDEMSRSNCCLLMEFIPGKGLFKSEEAFSPSAIMQTVEDLGRLFTLDQLLGNADRLPCDALGWRGNPENVMFAHGGRWGGRLVAIDALVQRRPPGGLVSAEDAACERLSELMLNDLGVARAVLADAVKSSEQALAAVERDEVVQAFQKGLKAALEATMTIKGLLEMMFDVINDWIVEFLDDIEGSEGVHMSTPRPGAAAPRRISSAGAAAAASTAAAAQLSGLTESSQTFKIRMIKHEAQHNASVSEKMAHWKAVFREKGEELRGAVEEWQQKRAAGAPQLTTGFLDGVSAIVDIYELKVRLAHMLQRLRALQEASLTARPVRLMPRLWLSGAVEANSIYLLQHLGITHVLNATEDLLLPEPELGFRVLRCPLRDVEEEDISQFFAPAAEFIDAGLASGGGVLVHCHAGRSRSCSLVLAWLMQRRRLTLKRALDFVQRQRPEAAPNAGYVAALLRLEEQLFGQQTVKVKKTKPELKTCPECGARVGLSNESVRVHLRLKHPGSQAANAGTDSNSDGGGFLSPRGSSPHSEMVMSPLSSAASGVSPRWRSSSEGTPRFATAGSADQEAAAAAAPQ